MSIKTLNRLSLSFLVAVMNFQIQYEYVVRPLKPQKVFGVQKCSAISLDLPSSQLNVIKSFIKTLHQNVYLVTLKHQQMYNFIVFQWLRRKLKNKTKNSPCYVQGNVIHFLSCIFVDIFWWKFGIYLQMVDVWFNTFERSVKCKTILLFLLNFCCNQK